MPDRVSLAAWSRLLAPPEPLALPGRWAGFYPYQQVIADPGHAFGRRHWLLAHAPGLGKTPMACWFLRPECCPSYLVVCPPSIVDQWSNRIQTWVGWRPRVLGTGDQAFNVRSNVVICPDSLIHRLPEDQHWHTVVIDECHRFKERTSRRTRRMFGGRTAAGSPDRWRGLAQCDQVVALTGTPVLNGPVELYPLLHCIAPEIAPTFKDFTDRYCPPVSRFIPGLNRSVVCYDQGQNLQELGDRMRGTVMVRPDAAACREQLPPLTRETFPIRIEDPGAGMFTAAEVAAVFSDEAPGAEERADPQFAELRRLTGVAKAEACLPWLQDLIAGGDRPVVWCWHREVAITIADALCVPAIHGGIPQATRQIARESFTSGQSPAFVCTIGSGGTGVDGLQANGSLAIFVEQSSVPAENEQAECRLYRAGQTRGVRVVTVRSNTAIDYGIQAALDRKATLIAGVMA